MLFGSPLLSCGGYRMTRRLPDVWLEHPAIDYLITAALSGVVAGIGLPHLVTPGDRPIVYQTLAGVSGGLLALGSIAVTVVFTVTPTPRLQMVLDLVGQRLRHLIYSSLSGLVITTGGALALFAADEASHTARQALTVACLALMSLRFGRLWWLFNLTLKTLVRRTPSAGPPSETWNLPQIGDQDYRLPQVTPGRSERQEDPS